MRRKLLTATALMVVILMLATSIAPVYQAYAVSEKTEMSFNSNLYKGLKSYFQRDKVNIKATYNDQLHTIKMENSEIAKVECLELNNNAISDITGLENFTNLKKLDLSSNILSEKSNLGVLMTFQENLDYLNISNNKISDVSDCKGLIDKLVTTEQKSGETIDKCSGIRLSDQTVRIVVDVQLNNENAGEEYEYKLPQILEYSDAIITYEEEGVQKIGLSHPVRDVSRQNFGYLNVPRQNTSNSWITIERTPSIINNPASPSIISIENKINKSTGNDLVKLKVKEDGNLTEGLVSLKINVREQYDESINSISNNGLYNVNILKNTKVSLYFVVHSQETESVACNDENFYFTVKKQLEANQLINSNLLSYKYITKASGENYYDVCDIGDVRYDVLHNCTVTLKIKNQTVYTIEKFDASGYNSNAIIKDQYGNVLEGVKYELQYMDTLDNSGNVSRQLKVKIPQINPETRNLFQDAYDEPYVLVITKSDINNKITSLILNDRKIEDLTGIEKFVGLESNLNVSYNYIDTLANIYSLQLNKEDQTAALQALYKEKLNTMLADESNVESIYIAAETNKAAIEAVIEEIKGHLKEAREVEVPPREGDPAYKEYQEALSLIESYGYDYESMETGETALNEAYSQANTSVNNANSSLNTAKSDFTSYLNAILAHNDTMSPKTDVTIDDIDKCITNKELEASIKTYIKNRLIPSYEATLTNENRSDYNSKKTAYIGAQTNYDRAVTARDSAKDKLDQYKAAEEKIKNQKDKETEYIETLNGIKESIEKCNETINGVPGDDTKPGLFKGLDAVLSSDNNEVVSGGMEQALKYLYDSLETMYDTFNKEYKLTTLLTTDLNYQTEEEYEILENIKKTDTEQARNIEKLGKDEFTRIRNLEENNALSPLEQNLIITGLDLTRYMTEDDRTIGGALTRLEEDIARERTYARQINRWFTIEDTMREIDLYSQAANYCLIKRMDTYASLGTCHVEDYLETKIYDLEYEELDASKPKAIYEMLKNGQTDLTYNTALYNIFEEYCINSSIMLKTKKYHTDELRLKIASNPGSSSSDYQVTVQGNTSMDQYFCSGQYYDVFELYAERSVSTDDLLGVDYISDIQLFEVLADQTNDWTIKGFNKETGSNNLFFYKQLIQLANKFKTNESDIENYVVLPNLRKLDVRNNDIETLGKVQVTVKNTDTEGNPEGNPEGSPEGTGNVIVPEYKEIEVDLTTLKTLKELYAGQNIITGDINCVDWSEFENLRKLDLSYNFITDIKPLEVLSKLRYLDVSDNLLEGFFDLRIRNMPKLKKLILAGNQYTDIGDLILDIEYMMGTANMNIDEYLALDDTIKIDLSRQEIEMDISDAIALEENNSVYELELPPIFYQLEKIDTSRTAFGTTSSKGKITARGNKAYIPVIKEGAYEGTVKVIAANGYPEDVTTSFGIDTICRIKYDVKNIKVGSVRINEKLENGEEVALNGDGRIEAGTSKTYTATLLESSNVPNETVEWDILSEHVEGTTITQDGILTISPDETATTITIEATSNYDDTKSKTETIEIYRRTITKININGPEEVVTGKEAEILVEAKGTDLDLADRDVVWDIEGLDADGNHVDLVDGTKIEKISDFKPEVLPDSGVTTEPTQPTEPAPEGDPAPAGDQNPAGEPNLEEINEEITAVTGKAKLTISSAEKAAKLIITATPTSDKVVKLQEKGVYVVDVKQRTITKININGPEDIYTDEEGDFLVEILGNDELKDEDKTFEWDYVGLDKNGQEVDLSENTKLVPVSDFDPTKEQPVEDGQTGTQTGTQTDGQTDAQTDGQTDGQADDQNIEFQNDKITTPIGKATLKVGVDEKADKIQVIAKATSTEVEKVQEKAIFEVNIKQRTITKIAIDGPKELITGKTREYFVEVSGDHLKDENNDKDVEWSITRLGENGQELGAFSGTKIEKVKDFDPTKPTSSEETLTPGTEPGTSTGEVDPQDMPGDEDGTSEGGEGATEEKINPTGKAVLTIDPNDTASKIIIKVKPTSQTVATAEGTDEVTYEVKVNQRAVNSITINGADEIKTGNSEEYSVEINSAHPEYLEENDKIIVWKIVNKDRYKPGTIIEAVTEEDTDEDAPDTEETLTPGTEPGASTGENNPGNTPEGGEGAQGQENQQGENIVTTIEGNKIKLTIDPNETQSIIGLQAKLKSGKADADIKYIDIRHKKANTVTILNQDGTEIEGTPVVKGGESAVYMANVIGEYLDDKDTTVSWNIVGGYRIETNNGGTDTPGTTGSDLQLTGNLTPSETSTGEPRLVEVAKDPETKIERIEAEEGKEIPNVGGGKLTIGDHEKADIIRIKATSNFDNNVTKTLDIKVDKKVVESVRVYEQGLEFILEGSGKTQQFTAIVKGNNLSKEEKEVEWSITGQNSAITEISDKGFLIIGEDETADKITVKATSIFDNEKSGTSVIRIIRREVENVTIDERDRTVTRGSTYTYHASVNGKNLDAQHRTVTWDVKAFNAEGNEITKDAYTKISENGELHVGVNESAKTLKVIATSTFGNVASEPSIATLSDARPDLPNPMGYDIDGEDHTMIGISPETDLARFKAKLTSQSEYVIKVFRGERELHEGDIVATADVVKIYKDDSLIEQYVLVVKGDADGDGYCDFNDVKCVRAHIGKIKILTGVFFKAADINNDNEIYVEDSKLMLAHIGRIVGYKL